MLDTANCSLNCTVTAYDMIDCIEKKRANVCVYVCKDDEDEDQKQQPAAQETTKIAISVKQITLSEHKNNNNKKAQTHISTFTCSPDFYFQLSTTLVFQCFI